MRSTITLLQTSDKENRDPSLKFKHQVIKKNDSRTTSLISL